jgi:hypothetical protein
VGLFNWIKEKIIEPVIDVAEAAVDFVVDKVVTPVIDTVTDSALKAVGDLADQAGEAAVDVVLDTLDHTFDNGYVPIDPDFSRFEPVVTETGQVQSTTIDSADWTETETVEIRDALVAAQIGYSDYTDLLAAGAVDIDGYVIDSEILLEESGWLDGIDGWIDDRFEIIRVLEDSSSSFIGGFEANVTLAENVETGEFFIAIGGTNSLGDVATDISLVLSEDTAGSQDAIADLIDDFFENDIDAGAFVNIVGHSLGGAEAVLQYRDNPDLFDHVYAVQSVGIGGVDGTFFDQNIWDGVGDENVTEITGFDDGSDFNDLVTFWGHIGAGQTYNVADVVNADDEADFFRDLEFVDSHLLDNLWASLPGGQDPELPDTFIPADSFDFV